MAWPVSETFNVSSLPAGWNFGANFAMSNTVSQYASGYSLRMSNTANTAFNSISTQAEPENHNSVHSLDCYFTNATVNFKLIVRGNTNVVADYASGDGYEPHIANGAVAFHKRVAGSLVSNLPTVSGTPIAINTWYRIRQRITTNPAQTAAIITVEIIRLSDGLYLTSEGTWQIAPCPTITYHDASPLIADGTTYSGVRCSAAAGTGIYIQNASFEYVPIAPILEFTSMAATSNSLRVVSPHTHIQNVLPDTGGVITSEQVYTSVQFHRSTTNGFTPGVGTAIGSPVAVTRNASTNRLEASYVDSGLTAGTTYYYRAVVADEGNSANSNQVGTPKYWVSASGSDSADGSFSSPWQTVAKVNAATLNAGETVAFRGGESFSGTLTSPASGSAGLPIMFASYGTGQATIAGGSSSAHEATNRSYITLHNLRFTANVPNDAATTGASTVKFTIDTSTSTAYPGIWINACTVEGGFFGVELLASTTGSDHFFHSRVTNCYITESLKSAITTGMSSDVLTTAVRNHYGFYAGYNTAYDIPGNTGTGGGFAFWIKGVTAGLFEWNDVSEVGYNHARSGAGIGGPGGMFPAASQDTVTQFNHVHHVYRGTVNNHDGIGVEAGDVNSRRNVAQFNYTHDNEGAGILNYGDALSGLHVVRFNLSVNDCATYGSTSGEGAFRFSGGGFTNCYGNTIITDSADAIGVNAGTNSTATLANNAIIVASGVKQFILPNAAFVAGNLYWNGSGFSVTYNSSDYTAIATFRSSTSQESIGGSSGVVVAPSFVGSGVPSITSATQIPSIRLYTPATGSGLIDAGIDLVANAFTRNPNIVDMAGRLLTSPPNIGAYDLVQATTTIEVEPSNARINVSASREFTAQAFDQTGVEMVVAPTFTWSVEDGDGSIDLDGLYEADSEPGSATIRATVGSVFGEAEATIAFPSSNPLALRSQLSRRITRDRT